MKKTIQLKTLSRALGLAGLIVFASPMTLAADNAGWYIGGNVGQSRADIDEDGIRDGLQAGGLTMTSIDEDIREFGFKVFGGYQFNQYFALEGGYFDLGKFSYTANTLPAGTLNGSSKIKGVNLDLVGFLPFTDRFSAFGRIGVNHAKTSDSFTGTGMVNVLDGSPSKRDTNYKFGVGLQYALTPSLGLRGEAERYRINDAIGNKGDIDLLSVGLVYRFGKSAPAPVAPAPEPVAAVVAEPVRVVVPVTQNEQYCSILDIQFEINQNEIQREEKERLGVVGTFMKKYPKTTAVIEGHSDDIGSDEDNLRLSQTRADSVVSYLQDTYAIGQGRLSAVGYGESRPIADNATEEGKRANRRINAVIACATDVEGLTVAPARMTMAMDMPFDKNQSAVKPEFATELSKVAAFLKANPTTTATVEGHSGNADAGMAQQISQQRAQNVVDYLVEKEGISRSRLTAQGFGDTRPVAYNTSAEGQQENRRVNIIINYKK